MWTEIPHDVAIMALIRNAHFCAILIRQDECVQSTEIEMHLLEEDIQMLFLLIMFSLHFLFCWCYY